MKKIGIYGAGGFGREVAWLVSKAEEFDTCEMVAYIDDAPGKDGSTLNNKPVLSWESFKRKHPDALVALTVGDPKTRERMAEKCAADGFKFATLQDKTVEMSDFVTVGEGSIICCGSILTVNIEVGIQVHINLDCTVGHDSKIGDFSTVSPGVHISGNVHIGRGVYIGTGANIINGTSDKPLVIGDYSVIGAGACVTKDVEPYCLYAGVPAELKKRYT